MMFELSTGTFTLISDSIICYLTYHFVTIDLELPINPCHPHLRIIGRYMFQHCYHLKLANLSTISITG